MQLQEAAWVPRDLSATLIPTPSSLVGATVMTFYGESSEYSRAMKLNKLDSLSTKGVWLSLQRLLGGWERC